MKNRPAPATRLAQALRFMDETTGAIIPPIQPAATYARGPDYVERTSKVYRRDSNQTTEHAEKIIADLEDAEETMLFSSGMSAAVAVMEALPAGAHVVIPDVMYHGVVQQFRRYADMNRLEISTYQTANLADMQTALRQGETALVWVESPNNPDWDVTDIAEAAKIAHAAGALLLTDCTATPPCCTRALDLGADISFHSATKYLNGHSDVTAGALSVRATNPLWAQIYDIRKLQGTVLHSFDAFLLIRGMRTLMLRVEKATENALSLAGHFEGHPMVERVLFPGLPSHPGYEIAKRQTGGLYGGMLSIITRGTEQTAIDTARFCEVFYPATSLGGVESLIEHRKTVSGEGFKVHPNLLRLSIGIEDVGDLIADLEQALRRAGG
ncbi:aminotransferase class V-fold PLP-dependent enzyme [Roseovarius sp. LXJ103]|uniref:trans-sulfuration enzyme family protein n=1 Tax=Roseovarius carneus TaxID=2853164 RepID=UPI000D609BAF|nr:aminotransferase class I/II-fold pyridoxal phosphate-dependent enzyme [Roseovarius carneus]MBZ8117479.1 aminotransferase class V-fold PLP-dependent enzyme [Roseovarius carneus]PWE37371.1 cystathionine gamma-synthase [Pelagicola sp. LXJ1103]